MEAVLQYIIRYQANELQHGNKMLRSMASRMDKDIRVCDCS